jgi:hypothetical protein
MCTAQSIAILIPESLRDFSWPVYHRLDMRICQRCQHYIPPMTVSQRQNAEERNRTEQASPRFLWLHFDLKTAGALILRPVKSKEKILSLF